LLDGDSVQAALEALQRLLETERVYLFTLGQRPDGEDLVVARALSVGAGDAWRTALDGAMRGRGIAWSGYNALRPPPPQRDQVLCSDEIAALTDGRSREAELALAAQLGTVGHAVTRALICDGPSLLAWVGFAQAEPTTEHQRSRLQRLIPAFRRRLLFDRMIGEAAAVHEALAASLEEVNGAAWVLGVDGRVAHANTAGRASLDDAGAAARAALQACATGSPPPGFKLTTLRGPSGPLGHVVVERPRPGRGVGAAAARRFGLTPAQARVLEGVIRGVSNATIAADLGIAERTVEAHLTKVLDKAQVPSRAALIVQLLQDVRG
jgi:DNA-binding CsgD family transcriptional regulator